MFSPAIYETTYYPLYSSYLPVWYMGKKCSYCSYNLHFPYCQSRNIFIAHLASFFSVHIFCPLFYFICLYVSVCRIYLYISVRNSSYEFFTLCIFNMEYYFFTAYVFSVLQLSISEDNTNILNFFLLNVCFLIS